MGIIDRLFGGVINSKVSQISERIEHQAEQRIESLKETMRSKYGIQEASNSFLQFFGNGKAGGAKWANGLNRTGGTHYINHFETRQNARKAFHETTQARALVERFADTVVDVGLVAEPAPKREILGLTMEEAEEWSRKTEEAFGLWCKSKKQHRSETMNFYQAQRLYQIFQHRDGDMFTRLHYSTRNDLISPLQFSFIDPNQIRGVGYSTTYLQPEFDDGITRDEDGCELSFSVWMRAKDAEYHGIFKVFDIPTYGPKSGRTFMLHGFAPEYASQGRGYSRLASIIQEFENLTDFTSAQIKKAINQSNITMWVKPSTSKSASNPFEGIQTDRGAGPAAREFGAFPQPSPDALNITPESVRPLNFQTLPEAVVNVPGSTGVYTLNAGEELKSFDNSAPSAQFDTFIDSFCSHLSAATGMPLEVLLMKFNSNYSASRAALIMFWRVVQIWRAEMNSDFNDPIYQIWLAEEIAAGRIECPGWSDPRMRAAWCNCHWNGLPMPNIDPAKTAMADSLYVEMGATTLDRIAREHNGSNGASNRAKLAREYDELAIPPWAKNAPVMGIAPKRARQEYDDDDDDEGGE